MNDMETVIKKGDARVIRGWTFYDWANSVYPLVITTAIFPIFFGSRQYDPELLEYSNGQEVQYVMFFGFKLVNTFVISLVSSIYFLLIVLLMPMLTGIADFSGNKKGFLRFFCYLGSVSCMCLAFFDINHLELSLIPYFLAGIGFWSSLVYYNAYLPEIAEEKDHDSISARGFAMGYFGSVILLLVCLGMIMGVSKEYTETATRLSFVLTGLWWFGFAHVTFNRLPRTKAKELQEGESIIKQGANEIKAVWKVVRGTVRLKRYITAFFVYSMAVQTIMIMAAYFGEKEIGWGSPEEKTLGLIVSIVLIQLIAIPGAFFISYLSNKLGNIKALSIVLVVWVLICGSARLVTAPVHFYIIAGFVGFVMGGIQSLSRSTFSKYIPKDAVDTASFFSFYDISEKLGIVIGLFSYGLIEQLTGSMRNSILALIVFFIVGLLLLFRVPKEEKIAA